MYDLDNIIAITEWIVNVVTAPLFLIVHSSGTCYAASQQEGYPHGATVKTAISIDKDLLAQAEIAAQEMSLSRSRLFALALEQYLRRRQGQQMLEQINAAYRDEPDPDEQLLLEKMCKSARGQLEGTC